MSDHPKRRVRLRTAATDKRKALEHYQDLRRAGRVARAVVIVEDHNGEFTVLGQMLKLNDIAEMLLVAADAVTQVDAERIRPKPEPHEEPVRRGVHNRQPPSERQVTYDADGNMVPPRGENLISCGECNHTRWYVFHFNDSNQTSRYACAHCGNEVKAIRLDHEEGHA